MVKEPWNMAIVFILTTLENNVSNNVSRVPSMADTLMVTDGTYNETPGGFSGGIAERNYHGLKSGFRSDI